MRMSATCEKACGKLPTRRFAPGRIPPIAAPHRLAGQEPLEHLRASRILPERAYASASQKLHGRKTPSPGGSPSSVSAGVVALNETVYREVVVRWLGSFPERGRRTREESPSSVSSAGSRRDFSPRKTGRNFPAPDQSRCGKHLRESPAGRALQRSTGPFKPNSSQLLMALIECEPGHHFRMRELLPRPRTSQMPSSGSRQIFSR